MGQLGEVGYRSSRERRNRRDRVADVVPVLEGPESTMALAGTQVRKYTDPWMCVQLESPLWYAGQEAMDAG